MTQLSETRPRPLRCRIGLHHYPRDRQRFAPLANLIDVCSRCGQGRIFRALSMTYVVVPAEEMARLEEEWRRKDEAWEREHGNAR